MGYIIKMLKDKFEDKILDHIEEKEKFPTFPLPLVVKNAEDSCLFSIEDKKYIDLTSNRENNPVGYSNIKTKNENLFIDSELFHSNGAVELEESFKSLTGLDKTYFSSEKSEIYSLADRLINIFLNNSGKEKILVSATSANKNLFKIKDIKEELIPINNDSILKTVFTKAVGAVIVQLVQINDEVIIAEDEYLNQIKTLCERNNALFVIDASQISPLRLNKGLFNFDLDVKPDILIVSKGVSNGFPFSALICSEKTPVPKSFESQAGIYSQAYSVASQLAGNYSSEKSLEILNSNIEYISQKLTELSETHISLVDFYQTGMLFTIVTEISAYDFAKTAFEMGVIVDTLNDNKLLLYPPYNIKTEEIDEFIEVFDKVFDKLAEFDRLK
jgi:acetylornithine/succinyldiaminopimelate/putrescine aminotransferase